MPNEWSTVTRLLHQTFSIPVTYQSEPALSSAPYLKQEASGYSFFIPFEGSEGMLQLGPAIETNLSKEKLIDIGSLAYYMLYQRELDAAALQKNNFELPMIQSAENRQNITFHHHPYLEEKLFDCIRAGKPELVKEQLQSFPDELSGTLAKQNALRNRKNLAITAITLATRAAIDGGLAPELSFTMSDVYIQQIEEKTNLPALIRLQTEALCAFAEKVSEIKAGTYSRKISHCVHYIYQHLYEVLTLKQLADMLKMNPTYLSARFKQEVGIPIRTYIQHLRIEEAKLLLRMTDHSLLHICALLHFHDQSYFTKVFKKHTGLTPRKFREQT
ncbi:helix-turn-helix domain-containing protein [Terribacillus saccharophilus]|uniref:helix-turn-helix domain-containing protein n=1 Tax=Terribacillus saccharophilus TaxID=361277 RepID=UPI002DCF5F1A|nr:helix-turn-helix domain-containing protein [Terribacillus saccharophilus]